MGLFAIAFTVFFRFRADAQSESRIRRDFVEKLSEPNSRVSIHSFPTVISPCANSSIRPSSSLTNCHGTLPRLAPILGHIGPTAPHSEPSRSYFAQIDVWQVLSNSANKFSNFRKSAEWFLLKYRKTRGFFNNHCVYL